MATKKKIEDTKDTSGKTRGRPRAIVNDEETRKLIEGLARIQCTQGEAASVLGISRDTFNLFLQSNDEVREIWESGFEGGRASLRRKQFDLALKGDRVMLIWLGKQYLGQSDKNELAGPGGKPLPAPTIYQLPDNGRG